jgi:hypothetical protein
MGIFHTKTEYRITIFDGFLGTFPGQFLNKFILKANTSAQNKNILVLAVCNHCKNLLQFKYNTKRHTQRKREKRI